MGNLICSRGGDGEKKKKEHYKHRSKTWCHICTKWLYVLLASKAEVKTWEMGAPRGQGRGVQNVPTEVQGIIVKQHYNTYERRITQEGLNVSEDSSDIQQLGRIVQSL